MRFPIIVRRVVGHSMEPALKPGQIVIASPWLKPKEGDVVVAYVEGRDFVKRISKISGSQVFLEGDNPGHSRDSRSFGGVKQSQVLGRVIAFPRLTFFNNTKQINTNSNTFKQ